MVPQMAISGSARPMVLQCCVSVLLGAHALNTGHYKLTSEQGACCGRCWPTDHASSFALVLLNGYSISHLFLQWHRQSMTRVLAVQLLKMYVNGANGVSVSTVIIAQISVRTLIYRSYNSHKRFCSAAALTHVTCVLVLLPRRHAHVCRE